MQPSSLNAPGPTPLQAPLLNPLALGPNPSGSNVSMTTNGLNSRGSIAPSFPLPERHGTEPTVSSTPPITHPLRTIHSSPQISFPQPTFVSLGTHPAGSNVQQQQTSTTGKDKDKANLEALVYPDGEIPVFDKDDNSWTLIRSEPVATQRRDSGPWWNIFGSGISWDDVYATLLNSHFLLLEKETSLTGVSKTSHVIRPIPLEYLCLASFNDEPEIRKYPIGLFKRLVFRVSTTKETMYPFTIYHAAAKITRRYTLYTKSRTERNKWSVALENAIETRKSQHDGKMLYEPEVLNDGFFRIAPRIQFTRGIHYTGRVGSAALFAFQGGNYIAVGCTSGIYVTKHAVDHSFRKVLEFNEPSSIVAVPEFNKFLVHCETTLSSYPLDKVIRVSQGDATIKDLGASEERLDEGHGDILFLKVGRIVDQTVVIFAAKGPEKVEAHLLKLIGNPLSPAKYLPMCSPITIPDGPHDATCFLDKVAICTTKAIYFLEPTNAAKPPPQVVPKFAEETDKKKKKKKKKGKGDITPKVVEMVESANVLGMVTYQDDLLLVYENLGCFVNQAGDFARSTYYIEWERRAAAFARRGPHLLLFSAGYIEVRNIDTGRLFRMVEVRDLRLLRSGLTEGRLLVGAMTSGTENDGSRTEKLVELVYRGD